MNDIPPPNVIVETPGQTKEADPDPTTTPSKPTTTGWGLFTDLLTTVKRQSEIVVDVYRRDLSEFVQVVQTETKAGVRAAAQTVERNVEAVVGPLVEPGGKVAAAAVETQKSDDEVTKGEGITNQDRDEPEPPVSDETTGDSKTKTKSQEGTASSLFRKVAARTTAAVHSFDTAAEAFENAAVSRAGELVQAATGRDPRELYDAATNGGGELVSKWGTQLGGLLSSAVTVIPPEEPVVPRKRIFYDRKEARLDELRMDPATYTTDPQTDTTDPTLPNRFQEFTTNFRIPEQAGHISRLLGEKTEIKGILGRLVPSEIPYDVFWQRYFFRVEELEREEERRRTLVQNVVTNEAEEAKEDFSWDMEDEESTENLPENVETQKDPTLPKTPDPETPPTAIPSPEIRNTTVPEPSNPTTPIEPPTSTSTSSPSPTSVEPEPKETTEPISKPTAQSPTSSSTSSSSPVLLRSNDSIKSCPSRTSVEGFELEVENRGKKLEEKPDPELAVPTPPAEEEEEDDWSDWE